MRQKAVGFLGGQLLAFRASPKGVTILHSYTKNLYDGYKEFAIVCTTKFCINNLSSFQSKIVIR